MGGPAIVVLGRQDEDCCRAKQLPSEREHFHDVICELPLRPYVAVNVNRANLISPAGLLRRNADKLLLHDYVVGRSSAC